MAYEQRSPDELRDLAEKIVKLILDDEELAGALCERLSVIGKQTCPKGHTCDQEFKCSRPFTCGKGHTVSKPPASASLD